MNKVIVPDVFPDLMDLSKYNERVAEIGDILKERNPDWILLSEDLLPIILEEPGKFGGATFIVPGRLVNKRQHQTKSNKLISYMVVMGRKLAWDFIFIEPGVDGLDKRIRYVIDTVEEWE